PLVPREALSREAALSLQRQCDEWMGPDARRVAYQVALENPAILEGTILWTRPPRRWLNPLLLRIVEPRLRRKFGIFPRELRESRERLRRLLPELQSAIARSGFLVGDRMTLADIAAVSLLDPLEIVPEFVRDEACAPLFEWKRRLAAAHRRRRRTPWLSGAPPRPDRAVPLVPALRIIFMRRLPGPRARGARVRPGRARPHEQERVGPLPADHADGVELVRREARGAACKSDRPWIAGGSGEARHGPRHVAAGAQRSRHG